ncbi:MAG TPA: glutathione S-transferase [Gammaproteobacteria bacterium]|nr:glutathione S-transferase [Gammaproteobacteria bacterium]
MRYRLYYWPGIQGRGEFVRLALEDAGADYDDVARLPGRTGGIEAMTRILGDISSVSRPFAPPFLKAGRLIIAQTANILHYLGPRLELVPESEARRIWTHQLQLTVADFVGEIHDVHHPVAGSLYYHQQKQESKRRAGYFIKERIPKYLNYFECLLATNAKNTHYLLGRTFTYVDLSMFQLIAGLRYAFPNRMKQLEKDYPRLADLHDKVMERPNVNGYLSSPRRIPFNENGIFRHYPELDN